MVSAHRSRELLGESAPTDDDTLLRIRDNMYALARVVVRQMASQRSGASQRITSKFDADRFSGVPGQLSDDESEDVRERAAIIEFDAGLSRKKAEHLALSGVVRRRKQETGVQRRRARLR